MIPNQKIEKPTQLERKCLMDSEAVARDKRYKLGVWLHGEYKEKFKKAVECNDALNNRASFH